VRKKEGIVYSTDLNFDNNIEEEDEYQYDDFILSVCFEKKGRAGKGVTIIKGFLGKANTLNDLGKELKKSLGVGGSIKNNEIIIQGRIQEPIITILNKKGYKTKKVGG
jgi:translation initiation factor 1